MSTTTSLLERLAEREGELDDPHARLGVVAVHVEDRRLHHLRDVGRVDARAAELRRGREPELVVHDDVDGAADLVARHLREVERLGHDTLAGERGVAVDEHREHLRAVRVAAAVFLRARHALDDRVDRLEVARVRRQGHDDLARPTASCGCPRSRRGTSRRRIPAPTRGRARPRTPEDLAVALPDRVDEDVEPAAVRGAEHHLGHAGVRPPR